MWRRGYSESHSGSSPTKSARHHGPVWSWVCRRLNFGRHSIARLFIESQSYVSENFFCVSNHSKKCNFSTERCASGPNRARHTTPTHSGPNRARQITPTHSTKNHNSKMIDEKNKDKLMKKKIGYGVFAVALLVALYFWK